MQLSADPTLSDTEAFLIARILNGAWGSMFDARPEIVRGRFASGQLFVVARDQASDAEAAYILDTYGLRLADGRIPIALLETIDAVTGGDPARVPSPFAALTASGAWRAPLPGADTLVFVDLTTASSRQRSGIGGEIVRYALAHRRPLHRYVYTFTPDVEAIRNWHIKQGARATGVRLANARPGHATPDVQLMDYSAV